MIETTSFDGGLPNRPGLERALIMTGGVTLPTNGIATNGVPEETDVRLEGVSIDRITRSRLPLNGRVAFR
ncbi:MAG: hypothetical protein H6736_00875 [Alphaproteobacteria bacterium]|nr:hypothetical protein [Alphaproteobacteria bacterium]MCB9690344.1 hypothetical protein [Alphaproteobacteria bacterium]